MFEQIYFKHPFKNTNYSFENPNLYLNVLEIVVLACDSSNYYNLSFSLKLYKLSSILQLVPVAKTFFDD